MIYANIVAFWKEHVYFSNAVKKIILKRLKEFSNCRGDPLPHDLQ